MEVVRHEAEPEEGEYETPAGLDEGVVVVGMPIWSTRSSSSWSAGLDEGVVVVGIVEDRLAQVLRFKG